MKDRTEQHRERLEAHVFVCTNDRDSPHANCAAAGGEETVTAINEWLRDRDAFWTTVSVSTTSCLGLCSEDGAAVSIQPRNTWYSDVTPADVPDLLESEFGADANLDSESEFGADANSDRDPG
ncbi:(2Fe-2S) ferredoxin domain-containing protein [Natrinema halophilum]|uniref:(2Fe-2S) ferredoxin domain-containing protein n=1 Tax=Natrinema halophilum TaxID=1699371 RepID=A0A7D5GGN3_9EURY|nr:(2Fe-2S) ferredoxin domain-containing protein [Natrinema halophilum]QLG48427.1 (2Fe-2S) ferredoxin domain-containing protein [Natrinema halophilum]